MSIFQGDVIIRNTIIEGLKQLRDQPFLIEDIFQQFACDPTLIQEYGFEEIQRAKDFLLTSEIEVVMRHRNDNVTHPYISIALMDSRETESRAFLSDTGPITQDFDPKDVDMPIDFVVGPFSPATYDQATGVITLPEGFTTLNVVKGQAIADPVSGKGVVIKEVKDDKTIVIEPNTSFAFNQLAVIPQFFFYKSRRGLAYFRERYQIGCHVHGEPYQLLYLHSAIVLILMRNKEDLLERRGFEISTFSSSDIVSAENFEGAENAYSRYITLEGDVELSWPLKVDRVVEGTVLRDPDAETDEEKLCTSGLFIIDGDDSFNVDPEN